MKIKRIKRLIESLNESEIRQLNRLMEAPFPRDSIYGKRKELKDLSIEEIANDIKEGRLEETKEILILQDKYGDSVAHSLAYNSNKTRWSTDDPDILMLQNKYGRSVAHSLAYNSDFTNWSTKDPDILMLQNKEGDSVAHFLARNSVITNWSTKDPDILMLQNKGGETVENILIRRGKK